jgi:hypothetical protein
MFSFEANLMCDQPDCEERHCVTSEPTDNIVEAMQETFWEGQKLGWEVAIGANGAIVAKCPECVKRLNPEGRGPG